MRPNNVAILRLILLSLQAHLHLLVLVAAGWNVTATHATGVPAATVLVIFLSILFILLVSLGAIVAFFKLPCAFLASIRFECIWTWTLVVVQLGATIGLTAMPPSPNSSSTILASHSFLVPAAWLATAISAVYAFGFLLVANAHSVIFPQIWSESAYSMDWFRHNEIDANKVDNDSWTRHLNDIEAEGHKNQPFSLAVTMENAALAQAKATFYEKAPWAQEIRRGVDAPFSRSPSTASNFAPSNSSNSALPTLPLRVQAKTATVGSRFIERFRDSWIPARTSPFPTVIDDHDKPIPVSKDVKWVRADAPAQ